MNLNEKIHLLESSAGAYVYLIDAGEKMLVDTGLPFRGKPIERELAHLAGKLTDVRHILLTHYDVDHIGNAARLQRLTGAQLWASREEIPYITGKKEKPGFKKHIAKLFRCEAPAELLPFEETLPGGAVRVLPSPGHTPGHVCLLFGGALFAGDIVENHKGMLRPYPAGWNWKNEMMLQSIGELDRQQFQWVCPAHGRPLPREAWDKMISSL